YRGRGTRIARRRRGPEGSILDGCDPRTGADNEASRDGSAARTSELFIREPLVTTLKLGIASAELERYARSMSLPPGPREPGLVQMLRWALRPIPFLHDCARRFGDAFTVHLPMILNGKFVFVSSPDLIRQIFTADPDELRAGAANGVL